MTDHTHPPQNAPPGAKMEGIPLDELKTLLKADENGLSGNEARTRLDRYGPNELPEKKEHPILKFLAAFWGPIPWMIEAAAILSLVVHHLPDFYIITVLLFANAVVGFWEEYQAGNAIAALKAKLAREARVKREGKWTTVPSRELVPGDVVRMRLGDVVPADARLLGDDPVEVDQSALTGESLPVSREKGGAVYSGSIVRQGETDGLVYATGGNTFFGKTARLVGEAHTVSHFQRAVLKIGNYLIVVAFVLVCLILAIALTRGDSLATTLQFVLVLTVAAIPVAMPTVLSVTMAVGARLLAGKGAIVSRLASIEELAGMSVLCSDKTGTLTQNSLSLGEPYCVKGTDAETLVLFAALASREGNQDTIDDTVTGAVTDKQLLARYTVGRFTPFDPVHKRTEAAVTGPGNESFNVTKGAPQVILGLLNDGGGAKAEAEAAVAKFASRGFRSLGVARTDPRGRWQLMGVLPLSDPPRKDSRSTIEAARGMNIAVKMVTGDQLAIGREIASQLGMGTNLLDARTLGEAGKGEQAALDEKIEKADGFAQVYPEHKYRIVEALQRSGHITGMTGDGVNDAPALKKADVGIAVSGATDAARTAAAIVLTTPGLSVIIEAIRESRKIFRRMTGYATYRIAETIRVLLFMTLSIIVFNFYPVTAVMIVLLALLNDGAILAIAYDRAEFSEGPEAWDMHTVLSIATLLGVLGVAASFGIFYLGERVFGLDRATIQTLIYLKLSVAGHLTIFLTRIRGHFWSERPAPVLLAAVIGTQIVATLIAVYGVFMAPVGWGWAGVVWGYALAWFLLNDVVKVFAYRFLVKKQAPRVAPAT